MSISTTHGSDDKAFDENNRGVIITHVKKTDDKAITIGLYTKESGASTIFVKAACYRSGGDRNRSRALVSIPTITGGQGLEQFHNPWKQGEPGDHREPRHLGVLSCQHHLHCHWEAR